MHKGWRAFFAIPTGAVVAALAGHACAALPEGWLAAAPRDFGGTGAPWSGIAGAFTGLFLGYWEVRPRPSAVDLASRLPWPVRGAYAGALGAAVGACARLAWAAHEAGGPVRVRGSSAAFLLDMVLAYLWVAVPAGVAAALLLRWLERRAAAPAPTA